MGGSDSIFADDVELIKNAEVLEEDYTPETILCRDAALDDFTDVLKPIYKGRPPQNAFLYGDTGVGKTAATKHLRDKLVDDLETKNADLPADEQVTLNVIWINCENFTTGDHKTSSYQVAVGIVNRLRDKGNRITGTGYAPQDVYDIMYSELDDLDGTVLIVLDEVDKIGKDDTLLYELPRSRDMGYLETVRVGVIGISNDYTFRKNLSPKVKDSLCETEIKFPPYDAVELRQILQSRAELALYDDAYTDETIQLVSALAYQEASGSARRAIRLLRGSAEIAEGEGVEQIAETHVRQADKKIEYGNIVESIADQDDEKLYILKALAHLDLVDKTPARTRTIHRAYSRVVRAYNEDSGSEPLTQRGMFNHLSKLVMFGFVHTIDRNKGAGGGQWNEHEFSDDVDPAKVKEAYDERGLDWKRIKTRGVDK
ncbi:cell division control protein 6 [Halohasta litchfieldiae]|jgi:cell division control protein 6|uniref:ORC1-type DNA replication protein n=1 Tax=Halohasta litchfieldiae TaxID=1073996 RepID=A0A1H6X3F0_9EURY|nr:orc1/cdc6 family replication initiation protein [Halohasta litchfieldiae]ATW87993.1 cell division control protein 6 [Halohasta litchfieldiae]SEJ19105.1 cell division control protein 6 [Halohasta litchfieldiae]